MYFMEEWNLFVKIVVILQFRGLGGELLPEHMVDLYAKQFDVWEQVSRRSSLSALSLAVVSPR